MLVKLQFTNLAWISLYAEVDGSIDASPKGKVRFTLNNPAFDKKGFPRAYSLPINIESTPFNKALLFHIQRLDSSQYGDEIKKVLISIAGIPWEAGRLKIKSVSDQGIKAVFENEAYSFIKDAEEIRIRELDIADVDITQTAIPGYQCQLMLISGGSVSISVNNVNYTGSGADDVAMVDDLVSEINTDHPGAATRSGSTGAVRLAIDPEKLIGDYVDVWFSAAAGYNWSEVLVNGYGASRLANAKTHFDNVSTLSNHDYYCPPFDNPLFYDGKNDGFGDVLNFYDGGEYPENEGTESAFVPFPRFMKIFDLAMDSMSPSYSAGGTILDNSEIQSLLFLGYVAIDKVVNYEYVRLNAVGNYLIEVDDRKNIHKTSFNIGDTLPDITLADMCYILQDVVCGTWSVEGSSVTLTQRNDQLTSSTGDWSAIAQPGFTSSPQGEGLTFGYEQEAIPVVPWTDGQLADKVIGDGDQTYTLSFLTLPDKKRYQPGKGFKLPYTEQVGSSTEFELGDNDKPVVILFYRGMQEDFDNEDYPLAQSGNTDFDGVSTGTYSLDISGATGRLYEESYKEYLSLLVNGKPITRKIELSINDLLEVRTWQNPRKSITDPDGTIVYVVQQVEVTVDESIHTATVKMIGEFTG